MKTQTFRLRSQYLAGGLLLALAGASPALADTVTTRPMVSSDKTTLPPAAEDTVPRSDRRFFQKATRLGEEEVTLSRIASDRAIHPQVRSFASDMVREHTTVNEELAALAQRKGAQLEPRDRVEVREEERKWAAKKGDDFDEDYLKALIDAHQDTIDVLENGAESKDPEIAAFANKTLPTVKAHLAHAESLKKTVD